MLEGALAGFAGSRFWPPPGRNLRVMSPRTWGPAGLRGERFQVVFAKSRSATSAKVTVVR